MKGGRIMRGGVHTCPLCKRTIIKQWRIGSDGKRYHPGCYKKVLEGKKKEDIRTRACVFKW